MTKPTTYVNGINSLADIALIRSDADDNELVNFTDITLSASHIKGLTIIG